MGQGNANRSGRLAEGKVSEMSFLKAALLLADRGLHLFPLQPNSKLPAMSDFPRRASKDHVILKKFWLDPVMELEQPYNIGVSCTEYNCTQALVVVDVDNKGVKHGSEEMLKLEMEGRDFPPTLTVKTPTGGLHLYYRAPVAVKQGESVLADGIDIRSRGGYVAGPGSVIDGKYYEIQTDLDVAECPQWILDVCGKAPEKSMDVVNTSGINAEAAALRAKDWLMRQAPLSIQGQGGDATAFKVAAKMKDFGVNQDTALELMLDHWNERCEPEWAADELEQKVKHAFQYGQNPAGADAPEAEFTKVEAPAEEFYLTKINNQFAIVFESGGHTILEETINEKGRPFRKFHDERTFKRMFSDQPVYTGGGRPKTVAELWLDWKGRRKYNGLCFKPEQEAGNGYYNTWSGFAKKPVSYEDSSAEAREGFDMFMDHALQNVCAGNEDHLHWLMGYFAHIFQKPYERPLTTLVFKGSKGVGKNSLIERIGKLIGEEMFLVADDSRYLTSNFNGHMEECLCLVLDEAFWSGDKAAEGKIKGLTTNPVIPIERKGKESYTIDNLVRLVVIGNEDWIVPASSDERRYAVFNVGEGKKKNMKFFGKMAQHMDYKGGAEVLMDYFLKFDLASVNVNDAPETAGLLEQKLESLSPFEQFWLESLTEGTLVRSGLTDLNWEGAELRIPKDTMRNAFMMYSRDRNIKSWAPDTLRLGRFLKKVSPSSRLYDKTDNTHGRVNCYSIPDLHTARKEFSDKYGGNLEWPRS